VGMKNWLKYESGAYVSGQWVSTGIIYIDPSAVSAVQQEDRFASPAAILCLWGHTVCVRKSGDEVIYDLQSSLPD
jgi:hypothetical protein